jgi:hypothetical protein
LNYTWLNINKYGGGGTEQNILKAEKFKYTQIRAGCPQLPQKLTKSAKHCMHI